MIFCKLEQHNHRQRAIVMLKYMLDTNIVIYVIKQRRVKRWSNSIDKLSFSASVLSARRNLLMELRRVIT